MSWHWSKFSHKTAETTSNPRTQEQRGLGFLRGSHSDFNICNCKGIFSDTDLQFSGVDRVAFNHYELPKATASPNKGHSWGLWIPLKTFLLSPPLQEPLDEQPFTSHSRRCVCPRRAAAFPQLPFGKQTDLQVFHFYWMLPTLYLIIYRYSFFIVPFISSHSSAILSHYNKKKSTTEIK